MSAPDQSRLWPAGFAEQFMPSVYPWAVLGPSDALAPESIKTALDSTAGTATSDVIAALVFEVDRYQITLRAQQDAIERLAASRAA